MEIRDLPESKQLIFPDMESNNQKKEEG